MRCSLNDDVRHDTAARVFPWRLQGRSGVHVSRLGSVNDRSKFHEASLNLPHKSVSFTVEQGAPVAAAINLFGPLSSAKAAGEDMQRAFIIFIKNGPFAMQKGLYQYFSTITMTPVIFWVKKKKIAQLLSKLKIRLRLIKFHFKVQC